jgi:hypothetical protein
MQGMNSGSEYGWFVPLQPQPHLESPAWTDVGDGAFSLTIHTVSDRPERLGTLRAVRPHFAHRTMWTWEPASCGLRMLLPMMEEWQAQEHILEALSELGAITKNVPTIRISRDMIDKLPLPDLQGMIVKAV